MDLLPLHATPDDAIPALGGWGYLTTWDVQLGALVPILVSVALYLWGVLRLRRRGDSWPVYRTVSWVAGMTWIGVATFSFLGVYDNVLFWVHMVQHMVLTMVVGVHIAQAAPVTLALRALPKRPRGWLLAVLHSWVAKVLLFPPLTTAVMIGYPFALYMSDLYTMTMRNDWMHDALHIWMVYAGVTFFVPIMGVDPLPNKLPYPLRFFLVLLAMPGHAFIGVTIMGATRLIAEDWYLAFDRDWGLSPMRDQAWAGGILWATGDLTMLTVLTALGINWFKDSQKEAKRIDRALDRQEELEARAQRPAGAGRYDTDAATTTVGREDAAAATQWHENHAKDDH
ncbi:cytochrome c oxidase assembly protein [Tessaracoccus sp. SD287]|uniref:cytochrome c oxidase assembly protein n=1 Tax=Tessaracoccus sp. SD287 TaxID=2782008 RepID=UPI001A96AB00|nr:cytochrome c oxidase assembly protein [Tessaracoccus sp. SD287]MBO1031177.1 cytochrome c oxidase assembly protein [Tessaracoccus sp. SD287]